MKVVILAGGMGSRLGEETDIKPKPMVQIGTRPILWHIMKIYSAQGFNDFLILLGYKGYYIKEYFSNYFLHQSDITIDLVSNSLEVHKTEAEPWRITLVDTGLSTMTGGRIKKAKPYLEDETFMLTYGDGVSNIDLNALLAHHKSHNGAMTLTSVQPTGRFGALTIEDDHRITDFQEKPEGDGAWVNGGFFVCEPKVFDYIEGDATSFEAAPLENLARDGELYSFKHKGFWKCMDTLRDKNDLCDMWNQGQAQWKIW
ncbi:glucose-1-phosphate cytidylyltransferase [Dethiosulfatarculus sandiegensis]|uniref:Glucose-1-phosphate cytidylyltransferase n=1 Tax=Dethiosulfatarculus sandiegensis TaxID=1429043 RepID=A0A0D2G7F2_9BACT|nr:glucose-1-phosphate cytidylyltransferase [Dethiosulfatarculus sandiegensis]KIX10892.1 glucose-1-phosphate cytidylyltransferase [Dethiosulfatarculus sandiegensis]